MRKKILKEINLLEATILIEVLNSHTGKITKKERDKRINEIEKKIQRLLDNEKDDQSTVATITATIRVVGKTLSYDYTTILETTD